MTIEGSTCDVDSCSSIWGCIQDGVRSCRHEMSSFEFAMSRSINRNVVKYEMCIYDKNQTTFSVLSFNPISYPGFKKF